MASYNESKAAAAAAREAKRAILWKSAAEELETACARAEQVRDFINETKLALLRSNEIIGSLAEFKERRTAYFDTAGQQSLLSARQQMQIVRQALDKGTFNKNRVLSIIENEVIVVLRSLLGKIKDKMDEGE